MKYKEQTKQERSQDKELEREIKKETEMEKEVDRENPITRAKKIEIRMNRPSLSSTIDGRTYKSDLASKNRFYLSQFIDSA